MKKQLLYPCLALLPLMASAQTLLENFDDITTLTAAGWTITNQSTPVGTISWFQGSPAVFPAYNGADSSYIGVNFNSIAGSGEISNWLITPSVLVQDGDILSFRTRTSAGTQWNDRLEVRSSSGAMALPVGTTDVGSFTDLLLTINEGYDLSYPESWTRYEIVVAGVGPTPVPVNYALRYNVVDGGPTGTDSNFIGIDALFIGNPDDEPGEEPIVLCTPVLDCTDGDVITNVTFGSINNETTCSPNGYGDFTGMSTTVQAGAAHPISVTVGDGWASESVSVWIDYDNSSSFDQNEFTYIGTGTDEALSGSIMIPAGTPAGTYRMRVRVAAVGASTATWDMACDDSQGYGETEDYTVIVDIGSGISAPLASDFAYWPSLMTDVLNIRTSKEIASVAVHNLVGQQVLTVESFTKGQLNVSNLQTGAYIFRVTLKGGEVRTFKAIKE